MMGRWLSSSIAQRNGQAQAILMNRLAPQRGTLLALTLVLLSVAGCATATAQGLVPAASRAESGAPAPVQVTLSAPATTISWDGREPDREKFQLPLLYLHRQREATSASERTLEISLAGIGAGSKVDIEVVSAHIDVTTGNPHTATVSFLADRHCTANDPCTVDWTINALNLTGREDLSGFYSDLYDLRVRDEAGQILWESPDRPAFAALDTWDVALGDYAVRVYYATLFPVALGQNDLDNRLPPHGVVDFIAEQFVPIIQETWRTQVEGWGFGGTLHPDWDADHIVEVIFTTPPFALFDGTGTYTLFHGDDGRFVSTRRIWWLSSNNSFQAYEKLADAYKALFPHEFFHLMQWNVILGTGQAYSDLPNSYWHSWREGQATVAPTIQYPKLTHSTYRSVADRVLTQGLGNSWHEMEADPNHWYDSALYWRFLYEQYADVRIFRAALEEMTHHTQSAGDVVTSMKRAMDAAFARTAGPFGGFDESLVAFAQATYALRLANGRCTEELTLCAGSLYDPEQGYAEPPAQAELEYEGTRLNYDGAIAASYGTDFLEVNLDLSTHKRPLTVQINTEGTAAQFSVQLWKLAPSVGKPRAVTLGPELVRRDASGAQVYAIPAVDWRAYNRLALIITRVDAEETSAPSGSYYVTLEPMPAASDAGARD
jgi:hypothetical protein